MLFKAEDLVEYAGDLNEVTEIEMNDGTVHNVVPGDHYDVGAGERVLLFIVEDGLVRIKTGSAEFIEPSGEWLTLTE